MTLDEIRAATLAAKNNIWAAAKSMGRDPKIYLHWTAGTYNTTYPDYHINITGDGEVIQTRELTDIVSATWHRNTGSISLALCCAYNATPNDLGEYKPTDIQIEAMAQIIAVMASALDIPIDYVHVMTHGEAANNEDGEYITEPYAIWSDPQPADGDTRWDLAILHPGDEWRSGGIILRGKAKYYQSQEA